jgi:histo-blood group ABO system transferase
MAKVALCIIATENYTDFLPALLKSADQYFLLGHNVHYIIFTNKLHVGETIKTNRFERWIKIDHEPWPEITLKRYHTMSKAWLSEYEYCYYVDCDMRFVAPVGDEIFAKYLGVQHPGYYLGGGGWEMNRNSWAWMPECKRKVYIAGGFQGGSEYVKSFIALKGFIEMDIKNNAVARWHDEGYWNRIKSLLKDSFTILDPSYCMVEEPEKRKLWGIDHLEPKIIALAKDHSQYQK